MLRPSQYKRIHNTLYMYIYLLSFICILQRPEFKAQPLPDFGLLPDLPLKAPPHLTKPKPFSLQTEVRGEQHTVKQQEKVCTTLHVIPS